MPFGPQGPNGEVNGSDVLLYVDVGGGTQAVVGSQRGVDFKEASAIIDMSSKASRARRLIAGRYSSTVSFTHMYIPSASGYNALKTAARAGSAITIRRVEGGTNIEDGRAFVTALDGNFPDQGPSIVSVTLEIDDAWFPTPP